MPYLLDADWMIQALAGREPAAATLRRLAPEEIAVSVVTLAEVYEVAFNSPHPEGHLEIFRRFVAPFSLLPITLPMAELFAEVRARLRRRGELLADFDVLVAATAPHHDLTLLTFNARHFRRIPDLRLFSPS